MYIDPLPAAGRPIKTLEDDKMYMDSLPAAGRPIETFEDDKIIVVNDR